MYAGESDNISIAVDAAILDSAPCFIALGLEKVSKLELAAFTLVSAVHI